MAILAGKTVEGWIVIEDQTSDFVAIYATEAEAALAVSALGSGFAYGFGKKEEGSENYFLPKGTIG